MRFSFAFERLLGENLGLEFLVIGDASRRGEKHCIRHLYHSTSLISCQRALSIFLKKFLKFRKILFLRFERQFCHFVRTIQRSS